MKAVRLNLNILIIALFLTINTPDLIFAQNNSSQQKPKSTTTNKNQNQLPRGTKTYMIIPAALL